MKKGQFFALLGGIFGILGIVFLGIAVAWAVASASFQASAGRTEGTVIAVNERSAHGSMGTVWYPSVEYTVDGRVYSFDSSFGSNPPAYTEGDTVSVAYDPANPADAQIVAFWSTYLGPTIFGALGVVFTPIGAVAFVKGRQTLRRHAWLLEHGREVWAEIAHVGVEFTVKLNGRHPYVVHATWHDARTGRTHLATSDYLRDDPGPGLLGRTHVRVLYDPADPDLNLVDLSRLR